MTDEENQEIAAWAEQCRRDLDDMPYYEGTLRRDACIARYLQTAYEDGVEAGFRKRRALPEGSPLSEERLKAIRADDARYSPLPAEHSFPVRDRRELLSTLDHALDSLARERDRADRAERECAALANDREFETGLRASGVAAAVEAGKVIHKMNWREIREKYGVDNLWQAIAKECAGEPLAYDRLLAECRRKTAALQKIAYDEEKMIASKVLAIAREALEEQP